MQKLETKYRDDCCRRCGEISCTLDFNEALQTILDNIGRCLDVKASAIHLHDPLLQTMTVVAVKNLSDAYINQGPIRLVDSPMDQEVMKGKMIIIADALKNTSYRKLAESEGIRSILSAPLKSKDRVIGVLWLFSRKVHQFSAEEISYVTTLSSQGGLVLGNAKLYQNLRVLSQIGKAITSRLDLKEILHIIVVKATQLNGAKGSSILLLSGPKRTLEVKATYGLSDQFLAKGPVLAEKSIKECLEHMVIIPDVSRSKAVQYPEHLKKAGIRAILCTPLIVRGKCIGNLRIYMDHPRKFFPEDLELIELLSDFSGIAIENARLFNHLKRDYEDLTQDVWQWYDWGKRPPKI